MLEYQIENTIVFQPAKFRLIHNEIETKLSQKETKVLQLLCKYALNVVERGAFLQDIWGDREGGDANLNKSVLNLRRKFMALGYRDAIDTIPRVGYMLRLNALAIDAVTTMPEAISTEVVNAQPEMANTQPKTVSVQQDAINTEPKMVDTQPKYTLNLLVEEKPASARYKRRMPYLILIVAGLLSILLYRLYALYIGKEATPLTHKMAYVTPLITIFEMAGVEQSINYPAFIALLPSDNKMQASISNNAVSFIGNINGHRNWSKVFILDNSKNINSQLSCIASYIKQNSKLIDDDMPKTYESAISEYGSAFHKKRFYSACTDTQPDYIGEIVISSTHYPSESSKAKLPSSLIQNVLFNDKHDSPVFHFTSISRVNHLHDGKSKFDFFVNLKIKSLKIETIDQHKISNDKYLNMIFNEYEDDDIFLKSLTSQDGNSITVLSSIFDGTLSEGVALSK